LLRINENVECNFAQLTNYKYHSTNKSTTKKGIIYWGKIHEMNK